MFVRSTKFISARFSGCDRDGLAEKVSQGIARKSSPTEYFIDAVGRDSVRIGDAYMIPNGHKLTVVTIYGAKMWATTGASTVHAMRYP